MDDVAIVAWKLPVGENDAFAGTAGDALMRVAIAERFRDVSIAIDAEELVFARFGDLAKRQDPGLAPFGRTRFAQLPGVGPGVDAGPLVTADLTLEKPDAATTALVRRGGGIFFRSSGGIFAHAFTTGLDAARFGFAQCHRSSFLYSETIWNVLNSIFKQIETTQL